MASSLAEAEATLAAAVAARDRVRDSGESVSFEDKSYSTSTLNELQRHVERYTVEVNRWKARAAGVSSLGAVAKWG